eukprot:m51a1_g6393 hypothetical protein (487) ;mRNA; r:205694-207437
MSAAAAAAASSGAATTPRERMSVVRIGRRATSGHAGAASPPSVPLASPPLYDCPLLEAPASARGPPPPPPRHGTDRRESPPRASPRRRARTSSSSLSDAGDACSPSSSPSSPSHAHGRRRGQQQQGLLGQQQQGGASAAEALFTVRPRRPRHRPATILMSRAGVGDGAEQPPESAGELLAGAGGAGMREYRDAMDAALVSEGEDPVFTCQWVVGAPRALCFLFHGLHEHTGRHGKSEGVRGYFHSYDALVRMHTAYVRKVVAQFPDVPVYFVGHAFGATLALLTIGKLGGLVRGAVLASPYSVGGSSDVGRLARGWMRVACTFSPHSTTSLGPEAGGAAPSAADTRNDALCRSGPVRARVASEVIHAGRAVAAASPELLSLPVLFVHGAEDASAEASARSLHERASSRDKTLRAYRGQRRDVVVGDDPADDAIRDVATWVTEHAASALLTSPLPSPPVSMPAEFAAASGGRSGIPTSLSEQNLMRD